RERDPRVVRRNACCISASADRHPHLEHPPNGRCAFGLLGTVPRDEVLALVSHAVLNGDATAQLGDALDVAVVDRLAMVEQPVQAVEWNVTIDLPEHVQ